MWSPVTGLLWWCLVTYRAQVFFFLASAQGQNQWNGFRPRSKKITFTTPHPTPCGRVETPISKACDMGTSTGICTGAQGQVDYFENQHCAERKVPTYRSPFTDPWCTSILTWGIELYASATHSMPVLQWPGVHSSPIWFSAGPWWCDYQVHTRLALA
jgi:hypothetical protein